jgi:TetR/AcrR family transcriptional regulator
LTEAATAARTTRLPPGRHGLSRAEVRESQRQRLLRAAAEVLAEQGYGAITVTAVAATAGVSTATLYKRFDGLWDCLLAAYEAAVDRLCEEIALAGSAARGNGASEAIERGLALLASEPALANLLLTAPPTGALALGAARMRLAERLASMLRAVRPHSGDGRELPLIAGAMALASTRARVGGADRLGELAPTLVGVLLGP